ncbi:MAG TPA: L,D-transpeptidase family protein [Sphingomicrobium sp.]
MTDTSKLRAAMRMQPARSLGAAAALALALGAVAYAGTPAAAQFNRAPAASGATGASIAAFYRSRGGAPLWFSPTAGASVQQLLLLLSTAQADGLNPNRYRVRNLTRAARAAASGNPAAVQRAEVMLSEAFVTYAQDQKRDPNVGIIYVDPELRPAPPSASTLLTQLASAPSRARYVEQMGWMSPVYAQIRRALASRQYGNDHQRRLLTVNLDRARALPSGTHRYVIVNPAAQRLYMYENGAVVDYMRVVAGKPSPQIAQTPMMSALIRFAVLNPYWNAPPDIASAKLAPNVLKQGRSYLKAKGYQVMSDWSENARVVDPGSVDWRAVVAGRRPDIRLRQLPGPANSMGRMKFMFPNKQGIWLHDTPSKEVLEEAARLQSNGCVRLEDASRFARWLFNRPMKAAGARPEQRVALPNPVPIYITYLTAVPSGSSIVYFEDVYGLDRRDAQRLASR